MWHGEFRHEPQSEGSPVTFTLRLTQDGNGRVVGTVSEGPGGMPDEGRIVGECRRARLTFLKLMPVAHVMGTDGNSVDLGSFLVTTGHELAKPIEHPQLLYEGRLTDGGRSVTGTWRLNRLVARLKDGGAFHLDGGRGSGRPVEPMPEAVPRRAPNRGYDRAPSRFEQASGPVPPSQARPVAQPQARRPEPAEAATRCGLSNPGAAAASRTRTPRSSGSG